VSLDTALARIAETNALLAPPAAPPVALPPQGGNGSFAGVLKTAMGGAVGASPAAGPAGAAPIPAGGGVGSRVVAIAQREMGQKEAPMGSNNSPRIAQYRIAVPGGPVGPWCAYFASWVAKQAGVPLGQNGQGFARVDDVWAWAQRSGHAVPAASGQPKPGDLIIWDEHMGLVESVEPDGTIRTIEGNSSDQVARRTHRRGDAIGYVRLG
jgi:hypothetical protein